MSDMYANPEIETMPREALQALQLERLQKAVKWAGEKSSFYQDAFAKAGVSAADIQALSDIRKLPFVTPLDLRSHDVYDRLTLPLSGVLRFSYQEQPAGEFLQLYTSGDVAHNVEMMLRGLVAAGVNRTSVVGVQGDLSDSRLLDVQYALEMLGAAVVPLGTDYRRWFRLMDCVSMDAVVSTPQLIMQLVIQLQAVGKDIAAYPLRMLFSLNDMGLQNLLQRHVVQRSHARVYNFFAPPALGMAGALISCPAQQGQHVQEDYWYPEVIAFGTDTPVEDGQMGELVLTSLMAEALPLIRFRTGQAVSLCSDPCACGRTFVRAMTPLQGI